MLPLALALMIHLALPLMLHLALPLMLHLALDLMLHLALDLMLHLALLILLHLALTLMFHLALALMLLPQPPQCSPLAAWTPNTLIDGKYETASDLRLVAGLVRHMPVAGNVQIFIPIPFWNVCLYYYLIYTEAREVPTPNVDELHHA